MRKNTHVRSDGCLDRRDFLIAQTLRVPQADWCKSRKLFTISRISDLMKINRSQK